MLNFDDYMSDYCKEYYKEHPEHYPSKYAQIQYLLDACSNDVSNPPPLYDLIKFLQTVVTKEDEYYDEVQNYIENTTKAIEAFKIDRDDYVYTAEDLYVFRTYKDVEAYIKHEVDKYKKEEEEYGHTEYDITQIRIEKQFIYDQSTDLEKYLDDSWYNNKIMIFNTNGEIIDVNDEDFIDFRYSNDEEFPKLTKYHDIYLPYRPGDILARRGYSSDYDNAGIHYMMLYDWNRNTEERSGDIGWTETGCEQLQISMGEFKGNKFYYDHLHCIYEFNKVDIDELIESAKSEFHKNYYKMMKGVSEQLKSGKIEFSDALDLCIKTLAEYGSKITDSIYYWSVWW